MNKPLDINPVPMYNESAVVGLFFAAMDQALDRNLADFEFICVDDGCKDDTLEKLTAYGGSGSAGENRVLLPEFRQGSGHVLRTGLRLR